MAIRINGSTKRTTILNLLAARLSAFDQSSELVKITSKNNCCGWFVSPCLTVKCQKDRVVVISHFQKSN